MYLPCPGMSCPVLSCLVLSRARAVAHRCVACTLCASAGIAPKLGASVSGRVSACLSACLDESLTALLLLLLRLCYRARDQLWRFRRPMVGFSCKVLVGVTQGRQHLAR
jgi:hypothetical protein